MKNDLVTTLAAEQGLDARRYWDTICNTVIPGKVSTEQVVAFLAVANQYGLNPMTKEIYAFPNKGGISPIVSVDGWLKLANKHPEFDGLETEEIREDGQVVAVKCAVWRKDRGRPTTATEYMSECRRPTEPWKQWPVRMLTNKAMIQALRRAFSFAGIFDPDEGERIQEAQAVDFVDVTDQSAQAQAATEKKTQDLTAKLREEQQRKATASGQGDAAGQGAGESSPAASPKADEEPAPTEPQDDFDLMEKDAIWGYLLANKSPEDKAKLDQLTKAWNRAKAVTLCREFAAREQNS